MDRDLVCSSRCGNPHHRDRHHRTCRHPNPVQHFRMKYEREPYQPDWYKSDDTKIYYSVTSGSSVFNEWYEFDDRTDALRMIESTFKPDVLSRYVWFDGEVYEFDQFTEESIADGFTCDDLALKEGATVADLQEIINAESGF